MGEAPEWYAAIEACHYVPSLVPWELLAREDGEWWINRILASRNATERAIHTLSRPRK